MCSTLIRSLLIVSVLAVRPVGAAEMLEGVPLPPVWVTAARLQAFYLATSSPKGNRVWLMTSAGPAGNAFYVGFQGDGVRNGDEVIRIAGRAVKEMAPGEAARIILDSFSGRDSGRLELEVRGQKETEPRTVTIDRFWSPAAKGLKKPAATTSR